MEHEEVSIEQLNELYEKTIIIRYGKPDEFQLHHNNLTKAIAEFILNDYWKELEKKLKIEDELETTE